MDQKPFACLVERSRSGDRSAQEDLIAAVQNFVYFHCCRLLEHRENALDVTQEVLIAMVRGLPGLKEPAAFRAWLLKIICNRCRNYQTRGPKECQIPETPEGESLLETWADDDAHTIPDRALDHAETVRILRELVDGLTPEQRACVLLYYYDELKIPEIAASLSLPETTVKSRLYHARKALREGVEAYERRSGKLCALSLAPMLIYFFHSEAQAGALPASSSTTMTATALSAVESGAGTAATAAAATAAGTAVKIVAGVAAVGMVLGGLWMLQDFRKTKPPELPQPAEIGEVQLLEALRTVTQEPSDDLMTQFYSYYNTLGHSYELAMMPDFDKTHAPDWDALTLYGYLNAERAEDLTVTREELADTLGRFLPSVTYADRSSAYLTYEDGIYTPVPGDTMWPGYFRLTDWSVDASGLFTVQFDMLTFDELEGDDYETLRPNMKYLWDTSGAAHDANMFGRVLEDTILQVFQQPDYREHLAMTQTLEVQFRLSNDPAYPLQYYARSRTVCAAEGEAVPPW